MPLRHKVINVGRTSRAVILPMSWLRLLEEKHGPIQFVTIEVNGILKIAPVIRPKEKKFKQI